MCVREKEDILLHTYHGRVRMHDSIVLQIIIQDSPTTSLASMTMNLALQSDAYRIKWEMLGLIRRCTRI